MTAAVAPWVGAALAGLLGSYAAMFWVMAGIAATAGLLGLASVPAPHTRQSDEKSGPEPA